MLEKYKNNESHFATRSIAVLAIILLFILHSILFIDPNQASDLGNPSLLVFAFVGLPLLFILAVLDLIILAIAKAFTWIKFFINFGFFTTITLLIFLIAY
jgi:hypothetical protein